MAEEAVEVMHLKDNFYRDSFTILSITLSLVVFVILVLIGTSIYLIVNKPRPVYFVVGDEWRLMSPVPVNKPYLLKPDLLQWVSTVLPKAFDYDFVNYKAQLTDASQYFTTNGWKNFLNQINIYADYERVQTEKLFIQTQPGGAPFVLNQGVLQGRYAWWVQMPLVLNYISSTKRSSETLTLQVLVVRVPTLNNLAGVGIENVLITTNKAVGAPAGMQASGA